MTNKQELKFENFTWINITKPDEHSLSKLREEYGFHLLDIEDCLKLSHRSKIDIYDDYLFIALLFPVYDRETREIRPTELNIFMSTKYIITIQDGDLEVFNDFFNLFKLTSSLRDKYTEGSPEGLLYEILNKLIQYTFPMIDHLSDDCNNIEDRIFTGREKKMIGEILMIRRNVTDFRKIMQVHKNVFKKLIYTVKTSKMYVMKSTDAYFESLVDYTKEIWDMLENLKERIEALQQTNESQISFRMSDVMRVLTVMSIVSFPVTLTATVFGMNTTKGMPFIGNPYGFWELIALMAIMILTVLAYFKYRKWL